MNESIVEQFTELIEDIVSLDEKDLTQDKVDLILSHINSTPSVVARFPTTPTATSCIAAVPVVCARLAGNQRNKLKNKQI